MRCPGCTVTEMEALTLEAVYGGQVEVDLCHACHSFWFDGHESLQLSPRAVLDLFRIIHERQAQVPRPLVEVGAMRCPRCHEGLKLTQDLQRSVRFSYFRCPDGHGRQTTFFQFLKEKNLVKPLDARALAALRAQVKVIRCSNCGAALNLEAGAVCEHCRVPVSSLDAAQVERTLSLLGAQELKRQRMDRSGPLSERMAQLHRERFLAKLDKGAETPARIPEGPGHWGLDLIAWGLALLLEIIS